MFSGVCYTERALADSQIDQELNRCEAMKLPDLLWRKGKCVAWFARILHRIPEGALQAWIVTRLFSDNSAHIKAICLCCGADIYGSIHHFDPDRKFGFLACDAVTALFGMDTFLSNKEIGNFTNGDMVSFNIALNKQGTQGLDQEAFKSFSGQVFYRRDPMGTIQ